MYEVTIYYKNFTLGGKTFRVMTPGKMSNEDFSSKVEYVRRVFSYHMYPRWAVIRELLRQTYDMLRKNGMMKHGIKRRANILDKEFDAFEKLHTMDFDPDWVDVMASSMVTQLLPKANALRGAIGGVMMQKGMKNYVLYSYPQTVLVLAREGTIHHDYLIEEAKEKFRLNLSEVFRPLKGEKVLACCMGLMSAIEDAISERLPEGVSAEGTSAEVALISFERALCSDELISKAFGEAKEECDERDFNADTIAKRLSDKFKVTRV